MNLLLDTHILLWAAASPDRLSVDAVRMLESPDNQLWFSAASLWEITIKHGLGRPDFRVDPHLLRRSLLENSYEELVITGPHVMATARLPAIHEDPFDRLLVAQAEIEGALLLTSDETVARYPGPIRRV